MELTIEYLDSIFEFKSDGKVFWKPRVEGFSSESYKNRWNKKYSGKEVNSKSKGGYIRTSVFGKVYPLHRLVFFRHYGYFPECVDHINGVRDDNRIENLRAATIKENSRNRKTSSDNRSGFKGVYWCKRNMKYRATIMVDGHRKHLGCFEDPEVAHQSYIKASEEYFGQFARSD